MEVKIDESWKKHLAPEFEKEYFQNLVHFVKEEYRNHTVYPKGSDIFKAFEYAPFDSTKVVLLGQDPYHGPHQAHGLCFSVPNGMAVPPSLKNIFKELNSDIGKPIPSSGNLEHWARQGVLLLNATLTVRANQAGSHQNKGWELFTDAVIRTLSEQKENLVFLLWGNYAQQKASIIHAGKHCVLSAAHPSPFSAHRGFLGCKHFSKTNAFLTSQNLPSIDW